MDNEGNLSTSTTASQKRDLKTYGGKQRTKEAENLFRDEFSFGSYLHLVWRIEYLETQLKKRGVLNRGYIGCEEDHQRHTTIAQGNPVDEEA